MFSRHDVLQHILVSNTQEKRKKIETCNRVLRGRAKENGLQTIGSHSVTGWQRKLSNVCEFSVLETKISRVDNGSLTFPGSPNLSNSPDQSG